MTKAERREQEAVVARLRNDARLLASVFGLPLRQLDAERANVRRRYGVCYSDGEIRIRLRHARTGQLLKYSSMVDTLCHELAHLRHFHHGPRFRAFYFRILDYARRRGIYRPGPPLTLGEKKPEASPHEGRGKPTQLALFDFGELGGPRRNSEADRDVKRVPGAS